jgi:hypothetical protein
MLEGESLLNDAAGLVTYRVALAVAAGETFLVSSFILQFFIAAVGGIAVGCLVGWAVTAMHKRRTGDRNRSDVADSLCRISDLRSGPLFGRTGCRMCWFNGSAKQSSVVLRSD